MNSCSSTTNCKGYKQQCSVTSSNQRTFFQERRKEAERMAREREELRRQQEQLRYEQEKRNNLKRGREVEHGYVRFEFLRLSRVIMAALCS